MGRVISSTKRTARELAQARWAVVKPPHIGWTAAQLERWHRQTPKPPSVYDGLDMSVRPFHWSTPAPDVQGELPLPWRVVALREAQKMLTDGFKDPDIYADVGEPINGHLVIDIGFRRTDSRELLSAVAQALKNGGFPVRFGPRDRYVHLMDDLAKNVLTVPSSVESIRVSLPQLRELAKAISKSDREERESDPLSRLFGRIWQLWTKDVVQKAGFSLQKLVESRFLSSKEDHQYLARLTATAFAADALRVAEWLRIKPGIDRGVEAWQELIQAGRTRK